MAASLEPFRDKRDTALKPCAFTRCAKAGGKHRAGPPTAHKGKEYPQGRDLGSGILPNEGLAICSFQNTCCGDAEAAAIGEQSFPLVDVGRLFDCDSPVEELEPDLVFALSAAARQFPDNAMCKEVREIRDHENHLRHRGGERTLRDVLKWP